MITIITVFVLGVIFGSFINALVWRLHEQSIITERSAKKLKNTNKEHSFHASDLSIIKGRSMCPVCHHILAAADLIPVVSWLWLKGKCRYCHATISSQYPIVEIMTGVLFVIIYLFQPFATYPIFYTVFDCVYVVFFIALSLYDMKWLLLPNRLVYPLTAFAISQVITQYFFQHNIELVWQPIIGAVIIFGLFWGIYQVSHGNWIGGGDVKISLAIGLIAGSGSHALLLIFLASFLGTIMSIPLVVHKKRGYMHQIPFGPYLLTSCLIVMLFGDRLIGWYQRMFLG